MNPRPQAYESCALPTELLRRSFDFRGMICDMSRVEVLRGLESHQSLKVMSLARYFFSTPLYRTKNGCSESITKKLGFANILERYSVDKNELYERNSTS